jgi:hypothetical protein
LKILFLDIDGVLNSEKYFKEHIEEIKSQSTFITRCCSELDPEMVCRVKRIVDSTGCSVVISSTWRILHSIEEIKQMLAARGWDNCPIIDVTPRNLGRSMKRGDEIKFWLDQHPEVTKFVCLDDDSDFYSNQNLVKTTWKEGIKDSHIEAAISILS